MIYGWPTAWYWADVLSIFNVVFAFLVVAVNVALIRREKGAPWWWLRMLLIFMGLYWGGLYVFVLYAEPGTYDAVAFGRVFVRPMNTYTLALIAACGVYRLCSLRRR